MTEVSERSRSEKETIHSGHFMVSDFEAEAQDDYDGVALPVADESTKLTVVVGHPVNPSLQTYGVRIKNEVHQQQHFSIETSLTKLFKCMSLAYRQKLTSPKWNRFKGIKLRWKDKIRLNNVIWRCWHMQFIKKQNAIVCQFASPLDVDTHVKPETTILEGKYWKRRGDAIIAEYKKWRMFFLRKEDVNVKELFQTMDTESMDSLAQEGDDMAGCMLVDEDYINFMSDTLFSTITSNQPYAFPDTREIARGANLADFIQPSLGPLQPNLDDFMDTLEPLQELFGISRLPPVPEETPNQETNYLMDSHTEHPREVMHIANINQRSVELKSPERSGYSLMSSSSEATANVGTTNVYEENCNTAGTSCIHKPQYNLHHNIHNIDNQPQYDNKTYTVITHGVSASQSAPEMVSLLQRPSVHHQPQQQQQQQTYDRRSPHRTNASANTQYNMQIIHYQQPNIQYNQIEQKHSTVLFNQKTPVVQRPHQQSHGFMAQTRPPESVISQNRHSDNLMAQVRPQGSPETIMSQQRTDALVNQTESVLPQRGVEGFVGMNRPAELMQVEQSRMKRNSLKVLSKHKQVNENQSTSPQTKENYRSNSLPLGSQLNSDWTITKNKSQKSASDAAQSIRSNSISRGSGRPRAPLLSAASEPTLPNASVLLAHLLTRQHSASAIRLNSPTEDDSRSPLPSPVDSNDRMSPVSPRRATHLQAEQKRRYNIKNGFDTLQALIPHLHNNPTAKVSKAAMLQKGAEYIRQLKMERNQIKEEMDCLRQQIECLNNSISNCHALLPATGAPVSRTRCSRLREMFLAHVAQRTQINWKYWLFSVVASALLESFAACVSSNNAAELSRTTLMWAEQHCSLVEMRPAVLTSLRSLCNATDILTAPERLPEEARAHAASHHNVKPEPPA